MPPGTPRTARVASRAGERPAAVGAALIDGGQKGCSLPEIVVEDFGVNPGRAFRPAFDVVWNAFGLGQSVNYDADGNWVEMR